jgi:hypothetical protein
MTIAQVLAAAMTNSNFSWKNETFVQACEIAKVEPTTRQASKFRLGRGASSYHVANAKLVLACSGSYAAARSAYIAMVEEAIAINSAK